MEISVIICTHNPREDYLRRTLEALKPQTLPQEKWELLLIDNASKERLSEKWDLTWHPAARHIREEELGLTPARLRGIREAAGEILVFVDDDNVLHHDYLETAWRIARNMPWLGCFNGSNHGEYDTPPEPDIEFMLPSLAVSTVTKPAWSCKAGLGSLEDAPCGAGMVLRKAVALHYLSKVKDGPLRKSLDRRGSSLISAGDSDMAMCACEMGLAVGRFPELQLLHLIPSGRLQPDYLLRLAESQSASYHVLRHLWEGILPEPEASPAVPCLSERLFNAYRNWRSPRREPTFAERIAERKLAGRAVALEFIRSAAGKGTPQAP